MPSPHDDEALILPLPRKDPRDSPLTRRTLIAGGAAAGALLGVQMLMPTAARALVQAPGGMYYPTDPWAYNNNPGTRYMDPRDDNGDGIPDRYHAGIDSQGSRGAGIYAVLAGQVVGGSWSPNSGYGNHVDIDHGNGFKTRYAHFNQAPRVSMWQQVSAGQRIGDMGNSGYGISHVHLHFEVFQNGSHVNPLNFLNGTLGNFNPGSPAPTPPPTPEEDLPYIVRTAQHGIYTVTPGCVVSHPSNTVSSGIEYRNWAKVMDIAPSDLQAYLFALGGCTPANIPAPGTMWKA